MKLPSYISNMEMLACNFKIGRSYMSGNEMFYKTMLIVTCNVLVELVIELRTTSSRKPFGYRRINDSVQ